MSSHARRLNTNPPAPPNLCSQAHGPEVRAEPALPNADGPAAPVARWQWAQPAVYLLPRRASGMNRKSASDHDSPLTLTHPHLPVNHRHPVTPQPPRPPPFPHHHTHANTASHKHLAVKSQGSPAVTSHHTGGARGGRGGGRCGGGGAWALPLSVVQTEESGWGGWGGNRLAPGSMATTLGREK